MDTSFNKFRYCQLCLNAIKIKIKKSRSEFGSIGGVAEPKVTISYWPFKCGRTIILKVTESSKDVV